MSNDPVNTGPRTRARYRYQDECVALAALQRLAADSLQEIYVEHPTDFVLIPRDAMPELVSIKHRESTHAVSPSWRLTDLKKDYVLVDLYAAWNRAGRQCTVAFLSNAGLSGNAAILKRWRYEDDERKLRVAAEAAAAQIGCSTDDAQQFVQALHIPENPLPRRNEITDVGIQTTARYLASLGRSEPEFAEICYSALVSEFARGATDVPPHERRNQLGVTATHALAGERLGDDEAAHRNFSASHLKALILNTYDNSCASTLHHSGRESIQPDPLFTGRVTELATLERLLFDGQNDEKTPVVIFGSSGCGKTALATEFAALHRRDCRAYVLDGSTRAALLADVAKLTPDEIHKAEPRQLHIPNVRGTLFIIDGVPDQQVVSDVVQRSSLSRVIVTSNTRRLDHGFHYLELNPWSTEESVEYLRRVLPGRRDTDLLKLADAVYNTPLAVAQAAKYCDDTDLDVENYLIRLTKSPARILARGRADRYPRSVVATIELSISGIRDRNRLATDILTLLSFFGQSPVPEDLVRKRAPLAWVNYNQPENLRHLHIQRTMARLWRRWKLTGITRRALQLRRALEIDDNAEAAVDALVNSLLVKRTDEGLLLHPLVRLIVRDQQSNILPWLEIGLGMLSEYWDPEALDKLDPVLPHAALLTGIAMKERYIGDGLLGLCGVICQRLTDLGDPGEGSRFGNYAVSAVEKLWSNDRATPHLVFILRVSLAKALYHRGDRESAISLLMSNMQLAQTLGWSEYLLSLGFLANFAPLAKDREICERILARMSSFDDDLPLGLLGKIILAHGRFLMLRRLNRFGEAAEIVAWCLQHVAEAELPIDVKHIIHEDAARLARDQGDGAAAYENELAALKVIKQIHANGKTVVDRRFVTALHGAADGAIEAGHLLKAEELLQEALTAAESQYGKGHEIYAGVQAVLGRLRFVQGNLPAALIELEQAAKILEDYGPSFHPQLPSALVHIAQVYAGLGRFPEAIRAGAAAYELDLSVYGPQHLETQFDLSLLNKIKLVAKLR